MFLARRVESDLDEEVRSHLEMLAEENIQAGMSPEEARRAARIELGGVDQLKEQVHQVQAATGFTRFLGIAVTASDNFARIRASRPSLS